MLRICIHTLVIGWIACLFSLVSAQELSTKNQPPNVIFIAIDDLRPMLGVYGVYGVYGDNLAKTPNIDKLAAQGVTFNRAYAQFPICGPSRASVMTGLRPNTVGVTHNYIKFRDKFSNLVTLPQYFAQQGYNAAYVGKIFHHGDKDDDKSWNWQVNNKQLADGTQRPDTYAIAKNRQLQLSNRKKMVAKYGEQAKYGLGRGPASEGANVADNQYIDGFNAELAIETITNMRTSSDKPIFFGFGLNKPHLPWIAPKKYWDMYQSSDIQQAQNKIPPVAGASMGIHASFELRTFSDVPNTGPISADLADNLKHAYLACISYVDAQIGKLIESLEKQQMLDNTIFVLWSDHGYHLGEMGIWGKASNYEIATRVPLIFSTPDTRKKAQEGQSNALVELVDIYPTLVELAGLPTPQTLEGKSMVKLLSQPNFPWKTAAFSQFPSPALREWGAYPLRSGMRETYFGELIVQVEDKIKTQFSELWDRELFEHHLMGYSMRTDQYRFIAWLDSRDIAKKPLYMELYDHQNDSLETNNIADHKPELIEKLLAELKVSLKLQNNAAAI
ncbi:sulfatase [Paraglaciecola sp. L3A3]|uniref:sulfatase n=1 Tax=Paraglaciecola sp. L3A3 TaxID=2686358 RepID=UPI00131BE4E3|nr:sulfatase [Paraglaciecola sp. L3A3]